MKFLVVSPATVGYQWEMEMFASSVRKLNCAEEFIWLTYAGDENDVSETQKIADEYDLEMHHYIDDRPHREYATSIRPFLIAKWLREFPERQIGEYFYCDSDMLLTKVPEFDPVDATHWIGSPTDSYSSLWKVSQAGYNDLVMKIYEVVEVSPMEALIQQGMNCPGAQWMIADPRPEIFDEIYERCEDVFLIVKDVKSIIPWFTDMWVTPLVLRKNGIEADGNYSMLFSSMDDSRARFDELGMFHDSLTPPNYLQKNDFHKGKFRSEKPFGHHFVVDRDNAISGYIEYMCQNFPGTSMEFFDTISQN